MDKYVFQKPFWSYNLTFPFVPVVVLDQGSLLEELPIVTHSFSIAAEK